ncbi:hypothetical protein VNI00_015417 [Paramarasmius palmivorus]|uniref:Glycosyl transferase CAP10 domain-containing protein n=1 Tax=Paramarasmius palmivorus TaxID=297713 RepID=A0AAW0BKP8_9AGAR
MPIVISRRRSVRLRRRRIILLLVAFLCGTILFWMLSDFLSRYFIRETQKSTLEKEADDVLNSPLLNTSQSQTHAKHALYTSTTWSSHSRSISLFSHTYHSSGLLEINPSTSSSKKHPIRTLIAQANQTWTQKLERQSKSLLEAVNEYKRRYHDRDPPLGFDQWWAYVRKHNVQLVDEYDQIWRDVEVFWGFSVDALERALDAFLDNKDGDVYLIEKVNWGEALEVSGMENETTRILGGRLLVDMLVEAGVDKYIPPLAIAVNPDDRAIIQRDWVLWDRAVQSARAGKVLRPSESPQNPPTPGWLSSCDPSSPKANIDYTPHFKPPSRNQTKTLIHNHLQSMDACTNPHLFRTHGQFLSYDHGRGPNLERDNQGWAGVISFSPTRLHADITAAIPLEWSVPPAHDNEEVRWKLKTDMRLHWRGTNTGMWAGDDMEWELGQRMRMMDMLQVNEITGSQFPEPFVYPEELDILVEGEGVRAVSREQYTNAMMDVAFAGQPTSCSRSQGICTEIFERYEWRRGVERAGVGRKRKFLLDVDGNAWSSRFHRLISTGSVVFKSTVYPEWWSDRVQEWVHYVPVQVDLMDLWDAYTFFRDEKNDGVARQIGANAFEWSRKYWRKEDMVAYNFRLFLEYARAMSKDRDEMAYVYDERDEV